MARINIVGREDGTAVIGWFDSDKAEWWDDADYNGNGSLGTGRGEGVFRTTGGKWVRTRWSNWQGERTICTYMTPDQARDWLIANHEDKAVATYFGELTEEEDRRAGRPEIGGRITTAIGDDLLAKVDGYAAAQNVSRAEAVRQLVEAGLAS